MLEAPAGRVAVNGTTLAWIERGSGPLVLCVHGFPDSMWSWVPVLDALAAAGYRAVAPALRGYAPSGPAGATTDAATLVADLLGLADALGAERFDLVGHDWGAVAAWALAGTAPQRLRRLVVASVPHGRALLANASPGQAWRSRYMLQLQVRGLPERVVGDAAIRALARRWSPTWDASDAELATVVAGLPDVAARRAAFGYYRGLPRTVASGALLRRVEVPALYLHGADDACVALGATRGQRRWVPDLTEHVVAGAGHFLHLERPDVVADRVRAHLAG